jgi:hypothetical protein
MACAKVIAKNGQRNYYIHNVDSVSNITGNLSTGLINAFPSYDFQFISPTQIRVESNKPIILGTLVCFIEELQIKVKEARRIGLSLEDIFVKVAGTDFSSGLDRYVFYKVR